MRDALRRGMGDVTFRQIRDNFDERQSAGEFLQSHSRKHQTGRQFTTRETIAEELCDDQAYATRTAHNRTDYADGRCRCLRSRP